MDPFRADGGYARWIRRALRPFPGEASLRRAVGGDYAAIGAIEADILKFYGLRAGASLVDVGCGVGRLAHGLRGYLQGPYLGTDVIPQFLRLARRSATAPNFRFERVRGLTIPASDGSVEIVCFYSVFTHLLHEHTYLYLEEARRVLAPRGRIVFSFHELGSPSQWSVFDATVAHARDERPRTLNVFVERPAIHAWAAHLGLDVLDIRDGAEAFVPLTSPIVFDSGAVAETTVALGQSVAVLTKRS